MSVRTIEQLEAALTEELKWRRREIQQWEGVARSVREHELAAVLRGGLSIVYGHWEGYVKAAAAMYLEFVARKGLSISQLRPELAAVALRGLLGSGESSKKSSDHTRIVVALREKSLEPARLPYDRATIRTFSNLSFDRFEDIMHSIGCDASGHEIHRSLIDNRLLKNRNSIAHGREQYVTIDDWKTIQERVFDILADVRTQISNAAAVGAYLRVDPGVPKPRHALE
ncbi:MAE_28990/MAE_18760 family HEPN-like nuclease [Micromonospora sp. CA-269861]|uniref:MAE_28990/MAE_18760 family HEPN-like nuclease n=1 Tax=Micromonospora sp. CA-269861 TaxID=3239968 RepID=UPI003D8D8FD9